MQNPYIPAQPHGTVPLAEVSGLAVGRDEVGGPVLCAIGDRSPHVAWAPLGGGHAELDWQVLDLADVAGTRLPRRDPQLEALAADGARGVLVVVESPNRAEFVDTAERRVRTHLTLDIGPAGPEPLRRSWRDESCSHTEGAVLLRDGHLLAVKEKDPVALLEFGPAGDAALGFGPDRWLPAGAAWDAAEGDVVLHLLACWEPDAATRRWCPDLSDAATAPAGELLLISDQAGSLLWVDATLPAEDPFAGTYRARAAGELRGIQAKPEGLAVLPNGDLLVACDRRKIKQNLFLVRAADWRDALR